MLVHLICVCVWVDEPTTGHSKLIEKNPKSHKEEVQLARTQHICYGGFSPAAERPASLLCLVPADRRHRCTGHGACEGHLGNRWNIMLAFVPGAKGVHVVLTVGSCGKCRVSVCR